MIVHGAIPNKKGAPVVDRWLAVSVKGDQIATEEVNDFISRVGLDADVPSKSAPDVGGYRGAVRTAVDHFQSQLVELRKQRAREISESLEMVLARLTSLEADYFAQLDLQFEEKENETPTRKKSREIKLEKRKLAISELFEDWAHWFKETREMVDDPNPYVDVKAVFVG